jgi:hypothetical protein|tara:strand:+ start:123 stop:725 length:603 start_codon:yes stop_codon:yes gene_type:complete
MKTTKTVGTTKDPSLVIYDDCMTPEQCVTTIELAQAFQVKAEHTMYYKRHITKERNDHQLFLYNHPHNQPFSQRFQQWMQPHFKKYCDEWDIKGHIQDLIDPFYKIQRSDTSGGFTAKHFEQSEGRGMSQRFAVWMIYLNDDFEGGETYFPRQEIELTPKTGSLVIWPAAYTHPHHAVNNLKGTKWIATGWFRFKTSQSV